jgi:ABC-type bacteriocin/lantibiotic exporter with double-glycine peptidase domain
MISIIRKASLVLEKKHKISFFFVSILILINTFFETLSIAFIIPVISALLDPEGFSKIRIVSDLVNLFNISKQIHLIILIMSIMILIFIIKFLFGIFLNFRLAKTHFILKLDLSKKLLNYYLNNEYQYFLNRNSSELFRNIEIELHQFTSAIFALMKFLIDVLIIISLISLLIYFQPLSALMSLIIITSSFFIFYFSFKKKLENWGKQRQYHDGNKIKILRQSFDGIKEIKIFFKERFFTNIFSKHYYKSNINFVWLSLISSLVKPWGEITFLIALTILLYITLLNNIETTEVLKILGLYSAVALKILPSANQTINNINSIKFVKASTDILYKEFKNMSKLNSVKRDSYKYNQYKFKNSIEIIDLNFKYSSSVNYIFNKFKINIKKSSLVAIMGSSGSGKSTLIDIIMGLLEPTDGKLLIDNKELKGNIRDWQSKIGYVPQTIYFLDDTIKKNIAFGIDEDEIDLDKINFVIEKSQLKELVDTLPDGVDTEIGEMGVRVSGGQRQRIGIARALYNNPSILILDEATNALDKNTEDKIIDLLIKLKESTTILYVTHRTSSINKFDEIINLDELKLKA